MFRKLAALCGALLTLNAPRAFGQDTLSPRYVQIIGVELQGGLQSILEKQKFECRKQEKGHVLISRYIRKEPASGIMVSGTRSDSPAERAGLQCGDMIVSANGTPINYAGDLQSTIKGLKADSEVILRVQKAVPGETDAESRTTVSFAQPVDIKIGTVTFDRVQALAADLPVRTRTLVDETYGPLVNFLTTSSFRESAPGKIDYTCTFAHRGEQEILPVESPFFYMVGITDSTDLKMYEERRIQISANVDEQGIPTLSKIPVHIATRIGIDQKSMRAFFDAGSGRSVGIIEGLESSEKNWYYWKRVEITCFLPEKLSKQIEAKIKRFGRIRFER